MRETGSAERRHVTVMFCDLVGSTSLSTRLDPEDLQEVIGAYQRAINEAVTGFDGFVAKYMGDGVLVYFGYPRAHEDDAERAVWAGLRAIEVIGGLGPVKLEVQIGIASGSVIVGDLIGKGSSQDNRSSARPPILRRDCSARYARRSSDRGQYQAADRRAVRSGGPRAEATCRLRRVAATHLSRASPSGTRSRSGGAPLARPAPWRAA